MENTFQFLVILVLFSCAKEKTEVSVPHKIILDTDMGSDCDDVGALALLNEYSNRGQVEILGVIYSSGAVPYGVGVIDAINRYYGNDHIPIGANYDAAVGDPVDKMQAEKLAKDTIAFNNSYVSNKDVPEQTHLLRSILSEQPDNGVTYITVGHTKGLYDLLVSKPDHLSDLSGFELVKKKIDKWVALGALNASNTEGHYVRDWNFFFNGTVDFTKYLVDHFPRPAYFVDGGGNVMTGQSLIHSPNGNIVRTAYRDWLWNVEKKTIKDQRPSWDLVAVFYSVEKPDRYFEVLTDGYLDFDPEKGCRWVRSDSVTSHHFVLQKQGYEKEISDYLNFLISKPGERVR